MHLNQKHVELINKYLIEKGIEDSQIRLELSDHLCELISDDLIDSELIPADILSKVDDEFKDARLLSIYDELLKFKTNRFYEFYEGLMNRNNIAWAFGLLIIHRIVFFVCLPLIPEHVYAPFETIATVVTAVFYIGIASFFILKARKMILA